MAISPWDPPEVTPAEAPGALELARRLIAREASASGLANGPAAATQAACERVYRGLALWLGENGAQALFTRALAQARSAHPPVREISLHPKSERRLDGVTETIQTYGASAVAGGLEAVLTGVLELLGRLLGADIATRLVEQTTPDDDPPNEVSV